MKKSSESFNKRGDKRRYIASSIEYSLDPETEATFDAVIADMSNTGLCLYTVEPLKARQTIWIKSNDPMPSKTAIVRWGRKYFDLYYHVGLEFL